jgi:carbon-monoxide dehydrogenase medium subunit
MPIDKYLFPVTVGECLAVLARYDGRARVIAGGTDLMLAMERGDATPEALVDISALADLRQIAMSGSVIRLGAGVTHAACAASPLIRERARCLAEACFSVGSPQIRNVATLGGNVVSAQPAADAAVALIALGAVADIATAQGVREVAVEDLYEGVGRCRVDSSRELLTGFRFAAPGPANAFMRFSPRRAMSLPMLNGAVVLSLAAGAVTRARIVLGPVAPVPFRPSQAEAALIGARPGDAAAVEAAANAASAEARPRDSLLRGSAAYRRELVRVLVRRAVLAALERAAGAQRAGPGSA